MVSVRPAYWAGCAIGGSESGPRVPAALRTCSSIPCHQAIAKRHHRRASAALGVLRMKPPIFENKSPRVELHGGSSNSASHAVVERRAEHSPTRRAAQADQASIDNTPASKP